MRVIAGTSTRLAVQRRAGGDAVQFDALTPDRTLHFGAPLTKMK